MGILHIKKNEATICPLIPYPLTQFLTSYILPSTGHSLQHWAKGTCLHRTGPLNPQKLESTPVDLVTLITHRCYTCEHNQCISTAWHGLSTFGNGLMESQQAWILAM